MYLNNTINCCCWLCCVFDNYTQSTSVSCVFSFCLTISPSLFSIFCGLTPAVLCLFKLTLTVVFETTRGFRLFTSPTPYHRFSCVVFCMCETGAHLFEVTHIMAKKLYGDNFRFLSSTSFLKEVGQTVSRVSVFLISI